MLWSPLPPPRDRVGRSLVWALVILVAGATVLQATAAEQWRRGRRSERARVATPADFDSGFQFCRVMFGRGRGGDGGRWSVDFPRADINVSIRLAELTKTLVSQDEYGDPKHLVVRLTDDELFRCPFIMMTEVGAAYIDDAEAARLREYLLKGGFLWADDFWGTYAWESWATEIGRVLPPSEYPILDIDGSHPLFRTHFSVDRMPQISSINYWAGSGGRTSERGSDSAVVHTRAISDQDGRIMVLMTHNTDIGDSWEREADDPEYFLRFAIDGYAVAINVLIYAMSH